MHGTGRHVPLKPYLHRLQNRAAVRVFAQTHDREQDSLLERAEYVCHEDYIVGISSELSIQRMRLPNSCCPDKGSRGSVWPKTDSLWRAPDC